VFFTTLTDNPQWRSLQMAVELVRHRRIDIIHAHLPNAHVLAGLASCLTGRPAVATLHGMNLNLQELGISRMTNTHLVVVCQQAQAEALALGIPLTQLTLIPNGVDLQHFKPENSGRAFRRSLKLSATVPLVGFVGRLALEKGPETFIRMASQVRQRCPDAHYVIVGDGPLKASLARTISKAGLGKCVHLAGVWPDTSEVYPALDIVVQTSNSEGMPLTLLEAMASGCPVIGTAVGGVPEIIEVGETGFVYAAGDSTAMAEGVINLLLSASMRHQMGKAARMRVKEKFNLQRNIQLTAEVFLTLIQRNSPRLAASGKVPVSQFTSLSAV
jgi:glycosyltransferase involved in cell wall biosynthesis